MPHEDHQHKENVHKLVYNTFDAEAGKFRTPLEVAALREALDWKNQ